MRRAAPLALLLASQALVSQAGASDLDDLLAALKKARSFAARGQVEVTVLFPPRAVPTRTVGALPALPIRPGLLGKTFEATRGEGEPVAGRPTVRYELNARAGQAARWTLWIDQEWNVPLAFEERTAQGELARRAVFQKVNAKLSRVNLGVSAPPAGLRAALLRAVPGLRLPAGFTPVEVRRREGGGLDVTLSDGLNVLALVTAPKSVRAAPGVATRRVGAGFVWLVGNLPPGELKRALEGVRGVDEAGLGTFVPVADSKE
ncbi:transcriptional regulator [Deinococcus koreensis]|uniref:transcriptional regulator n=1 Tax=Deinococcus koreensis TaxID=2054903 RepID=UPI001FAFAD49|nr:transcriptional regulator [Deinococcus koreensis]